MGLLWLARVLHLVFHPLNKVAAVWEIFLGLVDHVTHPWRKLFWLSFNLYLTLCSRMFLLTMKLLLMPVWFLTAIQREKLLEVQILEMQMHLTESIQRNRDLERRLEPMMKDRKRIKELLKEAENEQRELLEKFQLLQIRVQELEEQNIAHEVQENRMSKAFQEIGMEKREQNGKGSHPRQKDPVPVGLGKFSVQKLAVYSVENPSFLNKEAIHKERGAALSASIFSACLSLLVGLITWHAQDPCMPLVIALFIVVCMSLKSAAEFYLTADNRLGFDAVALMSFNWFILGTLAYPALPNIAQIIAPTVTRFGHWVFRMVGFYQLEEMYKSTFL